MPAAMNVVFECLELLGISLPREADDQKRAFLSEVEKMQRKLNAFVSISDLLHLPECTDQVQLSIFKLYVIIIIGAYFINSND